MESVERGKGVEKGKAKRPSYYQDLQVFSEAFQNIRHSSDSGQVGINVGCGQQVLLHSAAKAFAPGRLSPGDWFWYLDCGILYWPWEEIDQCLLCASTSNWITA